MNKIIRILFIILGSIFFTIGLIGLVLPVVPTAPFLIIAGLFYIKSSDKLYQTLIAIKIFGPHVRNYVEYRKIEHRYKILSILLIWIPTAITTIFIVSNLYVRLGSIIFGILVTYHLISLESIK